MMNYYMVEPEVAGNIADSTGDRSKHPPEITALCYEFDGWLGDVRVEAFPCFIVIAEVAKSIEEEGFTGTEIRDMMTKRSELFVELYPGRDLPEFKWLAVNGTL